jgi:orotate phosphoribosyltransferase
MQLSQNLTQSSGKMMIAAAKMQNEIEKLLAKRKGHFELESGHHGELWLDLELLMLHPNRVEPLAKSLAKRVAAYDVSAICAPLVEGAFVGLLVASALNVSFSYSQPGRTEELGLFNVNYTIPQALRSQLQGKRVAIVNDVINAGSAVRGTLAALRQCGAEPVVIATLAVLGESARLFAANEKVDLETLASFPNRIWKPAECPLCARGVSLSV